MRFSRTTGVTFTTKRQPQSLLGKIGLSLFLSFFLGMGLLFLVLIGREVFKHVRPYAWDAVECVIVESGIDERADKRSGDRSYHFQVRYRYEYDYEPHQSTRVSIGYNGSSDYSEAQRLARQYFVDSPATCYVNPSDPSEAVLRRQVPWGGLFAIVPLVFVAVGGGGIYFVWKGTTKKGRSDSTVESISQKAKWNRSPAFLGVFFSMFLLIGAVTFFIFFVRPVWKIFDARDWVATPCTILSSNVRSHSSDDGITYSIDILYSYRIDGEEFRSNRYHFMGGSSSGYSGKAAIVQRYPPGREVTCYVNPNDPTDAVIERGWTNDLWFGLIPLLFFGAGAGGLVWAVRGGPSKRKPAVPTRRLAAQPVSFAGSVVLKPKVSPIGKLIGIIIVCLFWNGIVSVFVWQVIKGFQRGDPEWFLTIFMIPFVLVGLGLVCAVGYFGLALTNPRPKLIVNSDAVPIGGKLDVQWELSGRVGTIQRLRIELEGREVATYRRGTRSYTDRETFARIPIAESTGRPEIRAGHASATVPPDTIHSFEASNNKIIWTLQVHGEIARWPDMKEQFEFRVLPLPSNSSVYTGLP